MNTIGQSLGRKAPAARQHPALAGLDAAGRAVLSAEVERAAAGRIRDIDLRGRLGELYHESSWRQRSRIIRAWLSWAAIVSVPSTSLEYLLEAPTVDAMLPLRVGLIPIVYTMLLWIWARPRGRWLEGATLPVAIGTMMIAAGLLGLHTGGAVYGRFISGGLFAASTAIVIFNVRLPWTIVGAVTAVIAYGGFSLLDPTSTLRPTLVFTTFSVLVIGCLIPARRTMNVLLQHAFLLNLKGALQGDALVSANARLAVLASTDALTGMPNRRAFEDEAARFWTEPCETPLRLGIALLDIDHFKLLNDAAGHGEGDRCLAAVAATIRQAVAQSGLGARYGGEEFVCLLSDASPRGLAQFAERIRGSVEAMAWPNPGLRGGGTVTVSVGLAIGLPDGKAESLAALVDLADAALYRAKAEGRNRVATAWALPVASHSGPASRGEGRLRA